ncbi:MAG: hypothetical protein KZQ60_03090 [Candidatus Thiodiazotropha sp. (ex Lucinoma aequizonata)]|nr:hypothetical protein [Candidatus Thiodiazotropha sp. (ex Lucinoma aequizonata)]MCU7912987.1 hypothetical protein [Candidatus Thiodiazotropha sp. (ex Lucinoma aequizonata)]
MNLSYRISRVYYTFNVTIQPILPWPTRLGLMHLHALIAMESGAKAVSPR